MIDTAGFSIALASAQWVDLSRRKQYVATGPASERFWFRACGGASHENSLRDSRPSTVKKTCTKAFWDMEKFLRTLWNTDGSLEAGGMGGIL